MTRLAGESRICMFPFIISFYTVVRYLLLSPCVFFLLFDPGTGLCDGIRKVSHD